MFPNAGGYCPDDGTRVASTAPVQQGMQGRMLDGRYEVREPLAQARPGAIGAMYRGWQVSVSRDVAIKIVDPRYAQSYDHVERFLFAGRQAAQLVAPSLANTYDIGRASDGTLYVISELVRGRPLADYVGQPMPARRVVAIALQLVEALTAVHTARLIHGDLDPANILIDETSGRDTIKLLDVGLAIALGAPNDAPIYVAPEQLDGRPDARSDLYSLGVILHHLLAGTPPFSAVSKEALAGKHRNERPPPLPPNVPVELASVVQRLLAKSPAERPATIGDVRAHLLQVQSIVGVAVARTSSADMAMPRTISNPNVAVPRTASSDYPLPTRPSDPNLAMPRTISNPNVARTASGDYPRATQAPQPTAAPSGRRLWVILLVAAIASGAGITAIMLAT
jgi:eukaryotic-like serine/threonine-protein kinase